MRAYFVASIAQKPEFGSVYRQIIAHLESVGYQVWADHIVGDQATMERLYNLDDDAHVEHYRKIQKWITRADIVVAEATFPSTLNIGHEISIALERNRPTIVLYQEGKQSFLLNGNQSPRLQLVPYTAENLLERLSAALQKLASVADARYHVHLSPRYIAYLDWVTQTKKMKRSAYIRLLIEKDRRQNEAYWKDEPFLLTKTTD